VLTVLIAENDAIIRHAFAQTLASGGYHVLDAQDTSEAIRIASSHVGDIDLLIANVAPPCLDGHALGLQLKKIQPDVRMLIVSTYTERELPSSSPHNALLKMPVGSDQLLQAVQRLLCV